jgi:uncharacterized protein
MGFFAWLVEKRGDFWLWKWIENTGRVSLSCYLFQNLLCTAIFYGWGFRLGGKMNAVDIIIIWLIISIIQLLLAAFWLRFAKLGPMETARKAVLRIMTNER